MEDEEMLKERKEKILKLIKSDEYRPLKREDICFFINVPQQDEHLFDNIIDELLKEGSIVETKKRKLMLPDELNLIPGSFISHSKGFGFVSTNSLESDIFIPETQINGAMHKDKVLCKITRKASSGKRSEGEIIKILERGMKNIVGTFEEGKGFGFVVPDDKKVCQDIFVSRDNSKGAVTGHKVVVEVIKWPEGRRNPEGIITEILGHTNDPGVDIISIIRQFDLPLDYPDDVYKQINDMNLGINDEDIVGREDFRKKQIITIDGEDAKDLDDAISLEVLKNGNYELGVHIADVTHYVTEDSPLDKEAFARGTSIYLVDRVIPMIPHKLSNGICSLNPENDRLTLSCIMEIDKNGDVVEHKIVKSVINSCKRMTYTCVKMIIEDKDESLIKEYSDYTNLFNSMEELRVILNNRRRRRGTVNFELPESKIILDEKGKPIDIKPYERSVATNIIEEFMLICNETVAEDFFWQDIPFLFRNHEAPDEEKARKMEEFIGNLGYRIKGKGELHPKALQRVLDRATGRPEEHIISRVILRSMKQAKYMAENMGHFGLAAKYYCHFTSPIRRYPDLEIHRIIKESIDGKLTDKRIRKLNKIMPDIAKQCSTRERLAEEAERETDKLKKVEFMADKVGEVFIGIISSLTTWGIYVELPNTVEGMVALTSLDDDYYIFDEEHMLYYGERNKKIYRLGDIVSVQVDKVSIEMRNIDFVIVDSDDNGDE